jgi:Fe2+ transport system protein FeoA
MSIALSALAPGQSGTICGFACGESGAAELMQMGLVEGSDVTVLRCAPTGDPVEIQVMGYALSLRLSEAENVLVDDVHAT